MWIHIIESIIVGIICWVIGTILFNISLNKKNVNRSKPSGIDFAFFTTGIILYVSMELLLFTPLNNR